MAPHPTFTEIFSMSQDPALTEVGGGHGQKGVDFQRFWAMVRIFELKLEGATDFLLLFESIQDVAEFDSETTPSQIDIYQIKKKDAGEWTFNLLTGLPKPGGKKQTAPLLSKLEDSPIGKLYKAGLAIKTLKSRIHFVSNAGCALPLAAAGEASKNLMSHASDLDKAHVSALNESLALLHPDSTTAPDLTRLHLRKTTLHPDDLVRPALGAAIEYLVTHMPDHASQAKALVDSLFMQLSTLGRRTEAADSFEELRAQRGFSMKDMDNALACLQNIPDLKTRFEMVLDGLTHEGLPALKKVAIHVGATQYFSSLVSGKIAADQQALIDACEDAAAAVAANASLLPALTAEAANLAVAHPNFKESEILAYLILQVTKHAAT